MSVLTRPSLLLATATAAAAALTGGLIVAPGAAWAADTTTNLTAAEMRTALRAIGTASTKAGAGGWGAVTVFTVSPGVGGSSTVRDTVAVDPVHGLFSQVTSVSGLGTEGLFAAEGKGAWAQADSLELQALKMMGKPSVKYVFTADKKLKLATIVRDNAPDPATLYEYYSQPGTKTVHDDGTISYQVVEKQSKLTVVMTATASSALISVGMSNPDESLTGTVSYEYEAQTVDVPAASASIDAASVDKGVAYLTMTATVKDAAQQGATNTRRVTKGRTVKVATLRTQVRKEVAAANRYTGFALVKTKNVTGGVRVYATNPWTKKSVTYSVKASGRKVVVKRL
ncbi:hypothetical protein [Actinoplanes sp. G11-F43]|uniref:hypothetical protein n=1 Tax=Actinoplanes sp. G11-F43 TaxID=3424130 RepID=UPI003D33CCF7